MAACGTCHVYVDPAFLGRLAEPNGDEEYQLDSLINYKPNSRLSCQIQVTPELDGLVLRIPESQG